MPREYSERLKKFKAKFDPTDAEKILRNVPEYAEQLKKINTKFATLVGEEFSLTPAAVKMLHGRKYEVYFAYRVSGKKILRPYLRLVTDFNGGMLLEFKNAYYDDFTDNKKYPLGMEFDATVPVSRTAKEQMERIKNLQMLYTKVRDLAFSDNLSDADKRLISQYAACLSETVPAELLSFCKDTESEFFAWLDTNN